ncbi:MAG: phytoene/squalene synthase family protein [Actinomycetota bacterium]
MNPIELHEQESTEVLARNGRSFHFASRLLSERDADRAARLYRFCRYVDDLADEADDDESARRELTRVEAALDGYGEDPIVSDFLALANECSMPLGPARELIAGVASDLGSVRFADDEELHRYCYRVAGTVGLMMCSVLDVHDPAAHPFAIDLGVAMQLTNIARDVAEDAARNRRYLPATLVGALEPGDLLDPDDAARAAIAAGVERLLREAERHYRSGEAGLVYLPPRARQAVWVAARVYREIGERLRRNGYRTWNGRIVVPTRKLVVAGGALVRERRARVHVNRVHDATLHTHLVGLPGSNPSVLAA